MAVFMEFIKSCFEESQGETDFKNRFRSIRNQIWIGLRITTSKVGRVINEEL